MSVLGRIKKHITTKVKIAAASAAALLIAVSPLPANAVDTELFPAGHLSDQPSATIGTIGAMAPKAGQPAWDGADRAHDMAFFGGHYAVIVGYFQQYEKGTQTWNRESMVIIDMLTGQPTNVSLPIKGEVLTVKVAPSGTAAYIGGDFTVQVDGQTRKNAAKFDLTTGALTAWNPKVDKTVNDIDLARANRQKVLLAGTFTTVNGTPRPYFASVNSSDGALTDWMNLKVTGGQDGFPTMGFNIVTNSDGSLIFGTGNFTAVNGAEHQRVFLLAATAKSAVLQKWATPRTAPTCGANKSHEELGAVFSGKYKLGLATTGGNAPRSDCDAVSVWDMQDTANTKAQPVWINFTDNDTMSGIAFYRGHTYGAGHNKWCSVKAGRPFSTVDRPGMCEYDAKTGALTSWNPTTSRQRSMHIRLVPTPSDFAVQGLFYVGDANKIGGQDRNDIAFFPAKP